VSFAGLPESVDELSHIAATGREPAVILEAIRRAYALGVLDGAAAAGAFNQPAAFAALRELSGERTQ
jgi:hypothetical protein